jgi:hypothetical protein
LRHGGRDAERRHDADPIADASEARRADPEGTRLLCLFLGRELGLPWATKLDPQRLPTGSKHRWVGRSKEGLLVLRP